MPAMGRRETLSTLRLALGAVALGAAHAESFGCRVADKELCRAALAEAPVLLQQGRRVAKTFADSQQADGSSAGLQGQGRGHGQHLAADASASDPASYGEPCQRWILEVMSDACFEAALTNPTCEVFEQGDCKEQWQGLHNLIRHGHCEAEEAQLSSNLLKQDVGGQTLFALIETVARKYGTDCRCLDDPRYRDPLYNSDCASWEGWPCSGYTFSEELTGACKISCNACTPDSL